MDSLCPRCHARIREDSRHCHACGVEIRPRALSPIPDGRVCPRCESELRIRMLDQVSVIECSACEGMWVAAATFDRLCGEAPSARPPSPGSARPASGTTAGPEPVRYIACLTCGELMFRRQFRHGDRPSGVILDRCKDHGIWLDKDELERVLDFLAAQHAAGRDTPPPPAVPLPARSLPLGARPARIQPNPITGALGLLGDLLIGDVLLD